MSDRDDAPPAEAVALGAMRMDHPSVFMGGPSQRNKRQMTDLLIAYREEPAAARWRLIGWLAAGLEPTREMVEAVGRTTSAVITPKHAAEMITAALAAAREAGDGS